MYFLFTISGPLFSGIGVLVDVQIVFWAGVVICGLNLIMNLVAGVMRFPLFPGFMMFAAGAAFSPWYWGAALGLACWTALEAGGEAFARCRELYDDHKQRNTPPSLPLRCGTIFLNQTSKAQTATIAAWRKAEDEYCAWVDAHPNPKREWVEQVKLLRQERQVVQQMNEKTGSAIRPNDPPDPPRTSKESRNSEKTLSPLSEQQKAEAKREGQRLAVLGMAMDLRKQSGLWPGYGPVPDKHETTEKIVWTPEHSLMGLGTVVLERPLKPLTLLEYRSALSNRIDRMVEQEDPEEAAAILSATVEKYEPLSVSRHLANAGNVLAEDSEWLGQRSGMFAEEWPVPPSKVRPDPELKPEDLDEQGLEEFLGMLYHDR